MCAAVFAVGVFQHKVGGVPQFVAEIAITLDAPHIKFNVAARRRQRAEGEAQRIGAVTGDAVGKFSARLLGDFFS